MAEAKYTIDLDIKGKDELNSLVAKLMQRYNLDVNANLGNIQAEIERKVISPAQKAKNAFAEWGLVINGIQGTIGQVAAIYNSTIGAVVRAAADAESATIKLSGALRASGLEVDANSARLGKFAASIQKLTVYEDDMLKSQMAQLQNIARFGDVSEIETATKAGIGLANAIGIDLATAMDLVGKAAVGNTAMLGRYGLVLDEAASDAEKFQQVLSRGLEYFPLAEQFAQSQIGSMAQLKNAWGDFLEVLGEGVLPAIQALTNAIKPLVESLSALGSQGRAVTVGLILMNAIVVKNAIAVMSQRAAFAALTVEQQRQVASMMMLLAAQKGGITGATSFGLAMKGVGASMAAAGNAVKSFLASIGPVGWIVLGTTSLFAGLNAIYNKNTKALKENVQAQKEKIDMDQRDLEKKSALAKQTIKLADSYEKLVSKTKLTGKEQTDLKNTYKQLQERYPDMIKNTGDFASQLDAVRSAASKAKGEVAALSKQMWSNNLEAKKLDMQALKLDIYDTLNSEFKWYDVSFTGTRRVALDAIEDYKDKMLLTTENTTISLNNLAGGLQDMAKQTSHFTNAETAALLRASNQVRALAALQRELNTLRASGPPKEIESGGTVSGDSSGSGPSPSESDVERSLKEYEALRKANFIERKREEMAVEAKYEEELKKASGERLRQLEDAKNYELASISKKYDKLDEDRTKAHYEQLKFYDSAYYKWKLEELRKESYRHFGSNEADRVAWLKEQTAQLDEEKRIWESRPLEQFEAAYEAEMGHLSELRELGLASYEDIAKKSWEYYHALVEIAKADGIVTEKEKELIDVHKQRAQAAQLAANESTDLAKYYNTVKFDDPKYYQWRKSQIEEDVKGMDLSENQKKELLKRKLDELNAEQHADNQDTSIFQYFLKDMGLSTSEQQSIIDSYSFIADQISSIWNQLYTNLDSAKQTALDNLEKRAKTERRSEAWLATEKEKVNEDYEKKIRRMKRTEQKLQVMSAMMNTAEGYTNALTTKPAWLAPFMAAAVLAAGTAQIAMISSQKFAQGGSVKPGIFRGKGTSTSDSNIIAVSDNEYIVSAKRVRDLGLPLLDALNFGDSYDINKAMMDYHSRLGKATTGLSNPLTSPTHPNGSYNTGGITNNALPHLFDKQKIVLVCDGREIAKATIRGSRRLITT